MIQMNSRVGWGAVYRHDDVNFVFIVKDNGGTGRSTVYTFYGSFDKRELPSRLRSISCNEVQTNCKGVGYSDAKAWAKRWIDGSAMVGYHDILDLRHSVDTGPYCRCAAELCERLCPSATGSGWPKEGECVVRFIGDPSILSWPKEFDPGIEYLAKITSDPRYLDVYDKDGDMRNRPRPEFAFVMAIDVER